MSVSTGLDFPARLKVVPWGALREVLPGVLEAVTQVLAGEAADRVLDRGLRRAGVLTSEARAAFAEAVFGVGLWRLRLAHHARIPGPAPGQARVLLFCLLRDLAGVPERDAASLTGLPPDALPAPVPPPADLSARFSFPPWLVETLARAVGTGELPALLASFNVPGPIGLRANLLKTTREALHTRLAEEGVSTTFARHSPLGLIVAGRRPNILGLASHQAGDFQVQDEGSQLVGLLLGARPGERVLDYCAGAGGKTLLLAAAMNNTGELIAHDVAREPLERLRERAARAGAGVVRIASAALPPSLQADRVLVDAPCSSLGALRRGPDVRFRLNPAEVAAWPARQLTVLTSAARHLKPGGTLVYATCTLRREENQEVAAAFERAHPELRRVPLAGIVSDTFLAEGDFLCLPHRHGTDGFYAAVFRREAPVV